MRRYLNYFKYVIRHKWFVMVAAMRIGAPLSLAFLHDLSKFDPVEFVPYAKTFYKPDGSKQYVESEEFNQAWNLHQKRNPHHWQYWILRMDDGTTKPIKMPKKYIYEMVADWMGAGRAITGKWEASQWYRMNRHKMDLHLNTVIEIEKIFLKDTERSANV